MRRLCLKYAALLIVTYFYSCNISSKGGDLYITNQTHPGTELVTIKILEHTNNQSAEKNIFSDYKEKFFYGGYSWYVYDIPDGMWDIYIEYYENGNFRNERESVFIDHESSGNKWVAIWLIDDNVYRIWTEQGGEQLNIKSSVFK